MTWSAYFFQVATGRIGPQTDLATATWDITINGIESLKAEIKKVALPASSNIDLWTEPLWGGILLTWNKIPIFAGPILGVPTQTIDTITFDCAGIRSILARRLVINELTDWSQLAKSSPIALKGLSLGTIAKRVVQIAQQKPGGPLPISYAVADQTTIDNADHQRTYQPFDLANLDCDAVLKKISEVDRGPDIMFKPRLIDDSLLTFDMWNGTEGDPYIFQKDTLILDSTAPQSPITNLTIASTASTKTNRVFGTGAGTDAGTIIAEAQNLDSVSKGGPLVETVMSTGSKETYAEVLSLVQGSLNANLKPLKEITLSLTADGIFPLGSYWPGDAMNLYLQGWHDYPDGMHKVRLLKMSGSLSNEVSLAFQKTED